MFKIPFYLLFIINLSSCATNSQIDSIHNPVQYDTITKVFFGDFSYADVGGSDLINIKGKSYLSWNTCGSKLLQVLDMQSDSVINLNFVNKNCTYNYLSIKNKFAYVLDLNGEIYRYDLNNLSLYRQDLIKPDFLSILVSNPIFRKSGLIIDSYKAGGNQQVNVNDKDLHFRVEQNFDSDSGIYSKLIEGYPIMGKLNLENNNLEFFGSQPKYFVDGKYGLFSNVYDLIKGDTIIFTNQISGDIEIINTINREKSKLSIRSKYDVQKIKPLKYKRGTKDIKNLKVNHAIVSPEYEALFYNPYTKYYYRIYHTPLKSINSKGIESSLYDKENILMIFDNKFNLIYDEKIDLLGGHIWKLFPVQNGILILLPDEFYPSKEKIIFKFLKVSHN
jgi:hypothetical protein